MFRFSIRDLLWATALVALGIAWWIQSRHSKFLETERQQAVDYARQARSVLASSKKQCLELERQKRANWEGLSVTYHTDWGILELPITGTDAAGQAPLKGWPGGQPFNPFLETPLLPLREAQLLGEALTSRYSVTPP